MQDKIARAVANYQAAVENVYKLHEMLDSFASMLFFRSISTAQFNMEYLEEEQKKVIEHL